MKNRMTFLLITSKPGVQRRFSINKTLFYFLIIFSALLLCSGIVGVWKAQENIELKKKNMILEAENRQMQAIDKTVKEIEQEEIAIRSLLGLEQTEQPPAAVPTAGTEK